jgi:hypothetical protein
VSEIPAEKFAAVNNDEIVAEVERITGLPVVVSGLIPKGRVYVIDPKAIYELNLGAGEGT